MMFTVISQTSQLELFFSSGFRMLNPKPTLEFFEIFSGNATLWL